MSALVVLLLGLSAFASAHYEGYPFEHKNDGKYGADHPYANYGSADVAVPEPAPAPVESQVEAYPSGYNFINSPYNYNYYGVYPGHFYGGHHGYGYGYNHGAYGHNHEFDYRGYPGFPVHQGYGQFLFLGTYGGHCDANHDHGLYIADDTNSFVVCVYGRAHRFQCPKGTVNPNHGHLQNDHKYGLGELCGVNTIA